MPSSQAALDSLVHSEKRLLSAGEPHHLKELNVTQHCNGSFQLAGITVVHSYTRRVALICDALDGIGQHFAKVSPCLSTFTPFHSNIYALLVAVLFAHCVLF